MNVYKMQSRLEEIKESFKVLYETVELDLNECTFDDIKTYGGDVHMANAFPSTHTQMFDSIVKLLDVCQIAVNCQLDVVNLEVDKGNEAEREFEDEEYEREAPFKLGICDDARLWKVV